MLFNNTPTYLIVGLGNPDAKYQRTFHNVGFMCIDRLADKLGITFSKGECRAITAHAKIGSNKLILAKPITYMNLSGDAVLELVNKYKISKERFIVVYDDVDLPIGKLRIRPSGSAGTHNGMRDIIAKTHTEEFARIRIGIGQEHFGELADYVLSHISEGDLKIMDTPFDKATNAVIDFINGVDIAKVMQRYN